MVYKEINSDNCIIAFIDILGYGELVESKTKPDEIYNKINLTQKIIVSTIFISESIVSETIIAKILCVR